MTMDNTDPNRQAVTSREQYEPEHGPDTGDQIDKNATDPTGERVSDPDHPDYVEPYPDANPVPDTPDADAPDGGQPAVPDPR
jgi:hypothetical protein